MRYIFTARDPASFPSFLNLQTVQRRLVFILS